MLTRSVRLLRPFCISAFSLALALLSSTSCSTPEATSLRLVLTADPSWGITHVSVLVAGRERRVAMRREVTLLLPDALAGSAQTLAIRGWRGETQIAAAQVTATPARHREVRVAVALTRIACGAWCTRGARECRGDGVVVCEQRDEDACMEWSEPVACGRDAPFCSLGQCAAVCTDECAMGEKRCEGGGAVRVCGQGDADHCLEWLVPVACAEGQACARGECTAQCRDECLRDAVKCLGAGRSVCGDRDGDGCTEWSPETPCAAGESCSMGRCAPIAACTDECTADTCDPDGTYRQCGNYNLDACRELSPGETCAPRPGSCDEVQCDPTRGCIRTERDCADAGVQRDAGVQLDAGSALDAGPIRVDSGSASRDAGDVPWTDAGQTVRDAGVCAIEGASCVPPAPASVCLARTGTCHAGVCANDFANDSPCVDGDACTSEDVCSMGICRGTRLACNTPPAAECIGSAVRSFAPVGTCSAGTCTYAHTDAPCPEACSSGRCVLLHGWLPTPISAIGAPTARRGHSAVWTGTEMIIWGGGVADGARYNPVSDTWTPMSSAGAPIAFGHSAVWTGSEMIVWTGTEGATYDPRTDRWRALTATDAPWPRSEHTAVWTGTQMIVWGGHQVHDGSFNNGGIYDLASNRWSDLSGFGADYRGGHVAVWTGSEMLVWGGEYYIAYRVRRLSSGESFNPATRSWSDLPGGGQPSARSSASAVWTGTELVVWGGCADGFLDDGGRYAPGTRTWRRLDADGSTPPARCDHSAIWTGTEMIIWGGTDTTVLGDGWRWRP